MFGQGGRTAAAVIAALLLASLSACTGSTTRPQNLAPTKSWPATPTAKASASASASATNISDRRQVEAVAKSFYQQLTVAVNNGKTDRIRAMTTRSCNCNSYARYIDKVWSSGMIVAPNYLKIEHLVGTKILSKTTALTNVEYIQAPERDYDHTGKLTATVPGRPLEAQSVYFQKSNDGWLISEIQNNG